MRTCLIWTTIIISDMQREIKKSAMMRQKVRSLDSRPYRIAYSLILVVIAVYVAGYLVSLNYQNSIKLEREIKAQLSEQNRKLAHIKSLKEEKIKLHDIDYLKEIARKELYLMPSKEVYIKILPNPARETGEAGNETRR